MANPQPILQPAEPTLLSAIQTALAQFANNFNCHEVGRIVSFDAAKQTASVQIMVLRTLNNSQVPYPVMTDCPVFCLWAGGATGAGVTVPVKTGDDCLIHFNDRDIDLWFTTGANVAPNTVRTHSLSDGFAEVGYRTATNPIGNYSTTDAELRNGAVIIGAGNDDKIRLKNSSTSLRASLDTLFSGLDALCSALTSWVDTRGDTPNPATIANINAAKATIDTAKTEVDNLLKA